MIPIDYNINITISLKTFNVKHIIKLCRQKILGQNKVILMLIDELSWTIDSDTFLKDQFVLSTYLLNEQNQSTSNLCWCKMLFCGKKFPYTVQLQ